MKIYRIAEAGSDREIKHLKSEIQDLAQDLKKLTKKMESEMKKLDDGIEKRIQAWVRADRLKKVRTLREWNEMKGEI